MKTLRKLSATTLFLFLSCLIFARPSDVNIRLNSNSSFKLIIDRSIYNHASAYSIPSLLDGYHYIAAYEKSNGRGNNHERLIFSGKVYIPESKKIDAEISRSGGFKIIRETPIHDNGHGDNHYGDNHYGNFPDDHMGNGYSNHNYHEYEMGDYEFGALKSTIESKSFDSSKLEIAKTALTNNRVTSRQVFELAKLYSFDSSKLEIAKFAYSRTVDQGNYFIVNNAFTFSSTSDDLNRFIRNNGF
jgi:hypothetical protein